MHSVFKYPVPFADHFNVETHEGARPLSVQIQRGEPQVWMLVDTKAPKVRKRFRLAGTGHPIRDAVLFVGTFQVDGGTLVFHLFEMTGEGSEVRL